MCITSALPSTSVYTPTTSCPCCLLTPHLNITNVTTTLAGVSSCSAVTSGKRRGTTRKHREGFRPSHWLLGGQMWVPANCSFHPSRWRSFLLSSSPPFFSGQEAKQKNNEKSPWQTSRRENVIAHKHTPSLTPRFNDVASITQNAVRPCPAGGVQAASVMWRRRQAAGSVPALAHLAAVSGCKSRHRSGQASRRASAEVNTPANMGEAGEWAGLVSAPSRSV